MHVAFIYTGKVTGGKPFLSTLQRRTDRGELRTWKVKRKQPLTLVHTQYPGVYVEFAISGTKRFVRAIGAFRLLPEPGVLASIPAGPNSAQVLGFLVGMLAREAEPFGVASVSIPLSDPKR